MCNVFFSLASRGELLLVRVVAILAYIAIILVYLIATPDFLHFSLIHIQVKGNVSYLQ